MFKKLTKIVAPHYVEVIERGFIWTWREGSAVANKYLRRHKRSGL
jgi:hypothetical protein